MRAFVQMIYIVDSSTSKMVYYSTLLKSESDLHFDAESYNLAYLFCWVALFQSDLTTTVFRPKAALDEDDPEWKLWTVPLSTKLSVDASHKWTFKQKMQF